MLNSSSGEQLGSVNFWVSDLTKQGKKTLKTFSSPYDFSSMNSACPSIGSCAELVSIPTNEPSSLIVDSWLRTPVRVPSLQQCVHVYDFKHMDVLFARFPFAVTIHVWRISLLDVGEPPGAGQALMRTISAMKTILARAWCDLTSGLQRGWR